MIDEIEQREKALAEIQKQEEIELFRYWLKMPTWKASFATLLLYARVSPDKPDLYHGDPEPGETELAVHFERFGLCQTEHLPETVSNASVRIIRGEHPPAVWIACYRDFPGFRPLPVEIEETLNRKPMSTDHGDHISADLALMNRAAFQYWSTADPDDRTTHPDNSHVSAWLQKYGLSKSAADNAASLIRPEWAATGRKPGKQ